MHSVKRGILFLAALFLGVCPLFGDSFFSILQNNSITSAPKDGSGIWLQKQDPITKKAQKVWMPSLEVQVKAGDRIEASTTYAKVYFFDQDKNLLATAKPTKAVHGVSGTYDIPFSYTDQPETLYFPIPREANGQQWTAVIVFGDKYEVAAKAYPNGDAADFDFSEKTLFLNPPTLPVERKPPMDPLVEYVVKTEASKQPQITLFLRPPIGMTDASQAQGVLALCLLANSVADVKKQLQNADTDPDLGPLFQFAKDHKLLILCWGSRGLWDPSKNYDEQSTGQDQEMEKTWDDVADAWKNGVESLSKTYGFPNKDFLLWGTCGAGQYACRLALHAPQYFLAVHIHIPASFDKPTPEANRILWCLTTGERYGGYEHSKEFYKECHDLGYPMIYKAFVGLGHSGSPLADDLGLKFFEYAMSIKDQRDALDDPLTGSSSITVDPNSGTPQPWLESFRTPPYFGDIVNQGIFSSDQQNMIPVGFRTPLPTKDIADSWNK